MYQALSITILPNFWLNSTTVSTAHINIFKVLEKKTVSFFTEINVTQTYWTCRVTGFKDNFCVTL